MSHRSLMKNVLSVALLFAAVASAQADMWVGEWKPIYRGVDHAVGTNSPSAVVTNNGVTFTNSRLQVVHCVRVDLTDPDIQLFTTPRASNYVAESRETLALSITNFIRKYGVQVAVNANFFSAFPGGFDPSVEYVPCEIYGLLVSTGQVVSPPDSGGRYASLMFTTNNVETIDLKDQPPKPVSTNVYTAVTGFYPVLTNGLNVWLLYYNDFYSAYADSSIHTLQPRTIYGLSQDRRYLYMLTIDGRQSGYSDGALDRDSAMWMLQFGAWDAINMDGGGSTAMYMTDCAGNPVPLTHSSLLAARGHERIIGSHLGVFAQPLEAPFITDVTAVPGQTTANITWTTIGPGSSQVEYGTSPSYGTLSIFDPTPTTSHNVSLTGLAPKTRYYYRVLSSDDAGEHRGCGATFITTNNQAIYLLYDLANDWNYSTANLDGVNWQDPGYDDSQWTGHGPGLLFVDTRVSPNPNNVQPENTELPYDPSTTYPFITYYFRTHFPFTFTNDRVGVTLIFSNYLDDGAVFYLNGAEVDRAYLPPLASNSTLATANNCPTSDATCPFVFTVSGDLATNLLLGDNVVAVEVHNSAARSPDITFGQALLYVAPPPPPPPFITNVVVTPGEDSATVTWNTISNATSRVAYSITTNINRATPIDTNMLTSHSVTVTGLLQNTTYYFRVISSTGPTQYTSSGVFATVPFYVSLVSLTNIWAYHMENLDETNWAWPDYDESLFAGAGPALLYITTNSNVAPLGTLLPATDTGAPYSTYYFRTHFVFETNLAALSLLFTSYIDDGASFYLNGIEIQRVRMPPWPQMVTYPTVATSCPHPVDCDVVTNAPDIFRLSGDLLTNLLAHADNVLAAEVHQANPGGSDVVFGSAVGLVRALVSETKLRVDRSGSVTTISWDGTGFTLQAATNSLGASNSWQDVAGPIKASPYWATNQTVTTFYRLRN